jgi:hypothetical protein
VVSLCRGNSPWYPLYRRLGRPQSLSGCYGEVPLAPTGKQTLSPLSSSPQPSAFVPFLVLFTLLLVKYTFKILKQDYYGCVICKLFDSNKAIIEAHF